MDIFLEKIVTKRKNATDYLIVSGSILGAIILILVVFSIPFLSSMGLLIAVGIGYLAYRLITARNIEYEYAVTNGDLDIDIIVSQRKRKRILSANCKDFDIIAKVQSPNFTQDVKNISKRIYAVSSLESPNAYFFTLNYKGEKTAVFFEPDERMLNAFKTFIPRKIFL